MHFSLFRPSIPLEPRQWLCRVLGGSTRRPYTADEVLAQLTPGDPAATEAANEPSRAQAIRACAAQPSEWLGRLDPGAASSLGRLTDRLPTIVWWYASGRSLDDLGERLCAFAGGLQARRALGVAARCIAARLKDRTAPAVSGAA